MEKSSQDQHSRGVKSGAGLADGPTSMEGVLELGGVVKDVLTYHLMWSPQEREKEWPWGRQLSGCEAIS